jgi:hypothetical protein
VHTAPPRYVLEKSKPLCCLESIAGLCVSRSLADSQVKTDSISFGSGLFRNYSSPNKGLIRLFELRTGEAVANTPRFPGLGNCVWTFAAHRDRFVGLYLVRKTIAVEGPRDSIQNYGRVPRLRCTLSSPKTKRRKTLFKRACDLTRLESICGRRQI